MNSNLKSKIAEITNQSELAKQLGCKQQTISLWLSSHVPANQVLTLCSSLGWLVTPHEVRSDLYPNPDDGLPVAMRIYHAPSEFQSQDYQA